MTNPSSPSWFRRTLASWHFVSLPLPRRLIKDDPLFEDSALKRGLRHRKRDEQRLRSLQTEAIAAVQSRDPKRIRSLQEKISEIAYGKGVTPQMREDFVMKYGCTGWTEQVLDMLVQLGESRGIVEIGAGHGQWARAITERHEEDLSSFEKRRKFDIVLAYDDMSDLPLSPDVYHARTQPAHDYFFEKVKKCDNVQSVLRQWSCRGRVLLVVYPPPGEMALETTKAYIQFGPGNDTLVYVGEGRGGANANEAFFDYLESGEWAILDVLPVQPPPGGKGYEKLYILQRIRCADKEGE